MDEIACQKSCQEHVEDIAHIIKDLVNAIKAINKATDKLDKVCFDILKHMEVSNGSINKSVQHDSN